MHKNIRISINDIIKYYVPVAIVIKGSVQQDIVYSGATVEYTKIVLDELVEQGYLEKIDNYYIPAEWYYNIMANLITFYNKCDIAVLPINIREDILQ